MQGYLYAAYKGLAEIYRNSGDTGKAGDYESKAKNLQKKVLEEFKTTDRDGTPIYAMALGYREGNPDVLKMAMHSSNPAHALWTGIFGDKAENVQPILDSLASEKHLWSGWGFRTLGYDEVAFDTAPKTGYHNGPIWPYEPILRGLALYAGKGNAEAKALVDQASRRLYELGQVMPGNTIPELISGHPREELRGGLAKPPEPLGTSSIIQSWSAAAMLELEQIRRQAGLPSLTARSTERSAARA